MVNTNAFVGALVVMETVLVRFIVIVILSITLPS